MKPDNFIGTCCQRALSLRRSLTEVDHVGNRLNDLDTGIVGAFGISVRTVERQINRALKVMRKRLKGYLCVTGGAVMRKPSAEPLREPPRDALVYQGKGKHNDVGWILIKQISQNQRRETIIYGRKIICEPVPSISQDSASG